MKTPRIPQVQERPFAHRHQKSAETVIVGMISSFVNVAGGRWMSAFESFDSCKLL